MLHCVASSVAATAICGGSAHGTPSLERAGLLRPSSTAMAPLSHIRPFYRRGRHHQRVLATPLNYRSGRVRQRPGIVIRCSAAGVGDDDAYASPFNLPGGEELIDAEAAKAADEAERKSALLQFISDWKPPKYLWRGLAAFILAGQVVIRTLQGRVHWRNTLNEIARMGPDSLGVCLLTASFVGMVFTIQFVREFARLGLTRSVGGVLALAMSRELSPVITAIIVAGRVGSSIAAELGTMQVSEQTDTLRVLRTDPVDYLVTPRVLACMITLPLLTNISFSVGMGAAVLLADAVYGVSSNVILDSAARALMPWDLISTFYKSLVFGGLISIVSCTWGITTIGGAKGVGESTTSAVVISLVCIFIADFLLSWCFFQGAGDALKAAMG
eukprot:jgi/Mesvir1/21892/Mv01961-RA.1